MSERMQDSLDRSPVGFPPPQKKQTRKLKPTQIITHHAVRKI